MIPTRGAYVATYRRAGAGTATDDRHEPIEAWSEDGDALIVDTGTGALIPANRQPGFIRLDEADQLPIVAAIPGGGWTLAYTPYDDPTAGECGVPVVAWVIGSLGDARPICVFPDDAEARLARDPLDDDHVRLIPPGEPATPTATASQGAAA